MGVRAGHRRRRPGCDSRRRGERRRPARQPPRPRLLLAGIGDPGAPPRSRRQDADRRGVLPRALRAGPGAARVARAAQRDDTTAFASCTPRATGCPGSSSTASATSSRVQFGTVGMKRREALVFEALSAVVSPAGHRRPNEPPDARRWRASSPPSGVVRGESHRGARVRRARPALSHPARARPEDGLLLRPALAPGARRAARARASASSTRTPSSGAFAIAAARGGATRGRRGRRERGGHRGRRRVRGAERRRRPRDVREGGRAPRARRGARVVRSRHRRSAAARADARRARAGAPRVREARRERVPRGAPGGLARALLVLGRGRPHGADARARDGRDARAVAGDGARAMVPGRRPPGAGRVRRGAVPEGAHRARRSRRACERLGRERGHGRVAVELARRRGDEARRLRGLLFDLDDTLLSHGVLTRAAYDALWNLHDAGLALVAVTGRPSGWGEVLVRQWPIDGCVTENGAVHVRARGARRRAARRVRRGERRAAASALARLVARVREVVPEARLTDDARAASAT